MRRQDGQARALFRLLTMPILAALKNADVIPVDGQEGGTEEAQFCKDLLFAAPAMGGMTHTFMRTMQQMVLALFNGFSAWELVYWVPKTGPNKGKITLRKIDWRPSETLTFLLDGQGEFCYTYDVEVLQLNGTSVPIGEMADRYARGEEQWVYSCTPDGKIVPGKVSCAKKTSDSAPLVEVELDNGEKVKCTLAHPWMLRDGSYKQAAKLQPGESLMPLYRQLRQVSPTSKEYEQVWHPGSAGSCGRWEYTHRMVSRNLGFGAGRGQVIHHWFDGLCQLNNDPRNLERMAKQAHIGLHARLGGNLAKTRAATDPAVVLEFWGNRRRDVTFDDIDRAAHAIVSAGSKLTWEAVADKLECSQDVIYARVLAAGYESWQSYRLSLMPRSRRNQRVNARSREKTAGTWQDRRFREITFEQIDCAARELRDARVLRTWRDVAGVLDCDQVVLYRCIQDAGYASWEDYRRSLVPGTGKGHSAGISFAAVDEVCRTEVAAGRPVGAQSVCKTLGCGTETLYRVLRAEGFPGWKDYKDSLTVNHKVVAVRFDVEPEAVYDIEVEDHHNFALKAGVFVHNSGFRQRTFFQGRTIDVKIAKETALYYACNEAERPFYGVSMFESAFFHYDKKTKLYYIAHLAAQRAACGTRVGTMKPNPSASDKNNFVKALANLGLAQYIVVPDADWTVNNLEEKGNFDFLGLINHHNSQMSKSVLAAWFDQDQGAGKGDSALVDFGNQDDATWLMMLDSILEEMAQVIDTHIFPRFVDWNFGSGKYPQFKWGELTAEQKAAIQDTFDKLAAAGQTANVTPEFMLELEERMAEDLGLDIDYDKIKAEREKQQKLMAKQANAQAQMAANGQPVQAGQGPQAAGAGAPPASPSASGGGGPAQPQSSAGGQPSRTGPGGPYS